MNAEECRTQAVEGINERSWHKTYDGAQTWIYKAGGGRLVEPWLLYVCSHVLSKNSAPGISSIDLALSRWVEDPTDRSVLLWVRALILETHVKDFPAALANYTLAVDDAPTWLKETATASKEACEEKAVGRKHRASSPQAAPQFHARDGFDPQNFPPDPKHTKPHTWDLVVKTIKENADTPKPKPLVDLKEAKPAKKKTTKKSVAKKTTSKKTTPKKIEPKKPTT